VERGNVQGSLLSRGFEIHANRNHQEDRVTQMKPGALVVFREVYDTIAEVERRELPLYTHRYSHGVSGVIRVDELSLVLEESGGWSRILTPAGNIGWIEDAFLHQPDVKISFVC